MILFILVAFIAYLLIGAFIPFIRAPKISDIENLKARAAEMQRDIKSPDRAAILETNISALDERIRLMNQAEEEIIIATYDLRDGESTRDLFSVALNRADDGVKIRLLTDGVSGFVRMKGNDLFHAMAAHPNIEIRIYNMVNPLLPWKTMGRMHDKYIIADEKAYILGGRNMFDYFIGDYPTKHRSHDREVLIYNSGDPTNSSIRQVRDYFEHIWALDAVTGFGSDTFKENYAGIYAEMNARYQSLISEKPDLFLPFDYTSATEPTQGVWLAANPTGLYAKEPLVFHQLYELMKLADKDIIIHSPYAVLNSYMWESLTDIAAETPVTLMVNAVENGDNLVASSDYTYRRSQVLNTGMNILEYAGGESYHGKSIAIDDDLSIIGSFNMDLRSTYVDTELMLVIRSEAVNRQLRDNMARFHDDCRKVSETGEIILPDHLKIPEAPLWKRAVWHVLGLVLQPFRILV